MPRKKSKKLQTKSRTPIIEKNIPIPSTRDSYELEFMTALKVGDSFKFHPKLWDVRKAVGNARNWAKRHGIDITSRTLQDGAIRVWRKL